MRSAQVDDVPMETVSLIALEDLYRESLLEILEEKQLIEFQVDHYHSYGSALRILRHRFCRADSVSFTQKRLARSRCSLGEHSTLWFGQNGEPH